MSKKRRVKFEDDDVIFVIKANGSFGVSMPDSFDPNATGVDIPSNQMFALALVNLIMFEDSEFLELITLEVNLISEQRDWMAKLLKQYEGREQ